MTIKLRTPVSVLIDSSGTVSGIKTVDGKTIYNVTTESGRILTDLHEDDIITDEMEYPDDNMSDVEADADALKSVGWGTDEDYA